MNNSEFIEKKLKMIRDTTSDMVNQTLYINLLRFEPEMFYNTLFDKCFENQEDFENIAYIMIQIENKKKEQINDVLKFLINVSYSYMDGDILQYKLSKLNQVKTI